jgi:hypothetical protein
LISPLMPLLPPWLLSFSPRFSLLLITRFRLAFATPLPRHFADAIAPFRLFQIISLRIIAIDAAMIFAAAD